MKDQSTENTAVLKVAARKSKVDCVKTQIEAGCVAFYRGLCAIVGEKSITVRRDKPA